MNIENYIPTEKLSPFIKAYRIIESDDELVNRVLPDTSLAIAFRYRGQVNYLTENGKENLPVSVISGLRGIELLEPSVLYSLCHDDLEELCCKYHDIEHVGRIIVNHGMIQMQRKIDDTHFATAKHRYENLVANTPSIIQRVPLGMVASFLGITQETLSRIRSQK